MKGNPRSWRSGATAEESHTRRKIQEASKQLIAQQGYGATTMRQVARQVSVKGASLYYHFPGKEAILYAILDEGNRRLLDAAAAAMASGPQDPPSLLRRLVREHIRILATDPEQFMVVSRELKRVKGERRRKIIAQRDQYEAAIQNVLHRGIQDSSFRRFNVKVVSYGIIAFMNGVAFWYRTGGHLSVNKIAEEYSEVLLQGLTSR
ncbi:MAG: TetR family transcriptional regulator [Burkholderiales bacterium]|nr:TetR family transcriptional regulator [Burkholderiales bacterium]